MMNTGNIKTNIQKLEILFLFAIYLQCIDRRLHVKHQLHVTHNIEWMRYAGYHQT